MGTGCQTKKGQGSHDSYKAIFPRKGSGVQFLKTQSEKNLFLSLTLPRPQPQTH